MNANNQRNEIRERELRRLLAEAPPTGPDLEPPADLLAKLQEEIPDSIELHPALRGGENVLPFRAPAPRPPMVRRSVWLLAASLIAMAGAGYFSLRLRDVVPLPDRSESAPMASMEAAPPRGDEVPTGAEPAPRSGAPADGSEAGIQSPSGPPAPPPPGLTALSYLGGPPASEPAPEKEKVWVGTEADLRARGGNRQQATPEEQARANEAVRRRLGRLSKPAQPVEVPAGVEGGVEGGVPGGVVG
ncbi:MAG TPA: hypothetical protein VN851_08240, partial [Thermoanaerobaculia bacterium]|nr:hypothetical protein [Thermoanaerobaculia bacterium]